ncbi:transcription initiation protein SPT3 homolog [Leptopilina boulardi]|uniref:transcription initiation protein SPT3 homolog n=1 Tax=Leptopilina boulardi TaxID=63433 RepID=UPI0021F5CD51|nr:transcription initiation protein SPT3 homolog [Leptopilina boulardi]XP_051157290.1 transcription initiation protein SPT3 homolog [Leptopilina boulardi]
MSEGSGQKLSSNCHGFKSESVNYLYEIQQMMHGFGDCSEPLIDSARIVEDIVLRQMRSIVKDAFEVAKQRGSNTVNAEDFIFLLRKDTVKLQRLIKYLDLKEFKSSIYKVTNSEPTDKLSDIKQMEESKKSKKLWETFLETLDTTGEICNNKTSVDDVKYNRCVRAEIMSKNLDEARYIDYSKARNVSFVNRHRHKFSDWIIPNGDVSISKQGYVILSYFAYETVAQIIDLAFLVRQDQNKIYGDALDRLKISYCNPQTFKTHQQSKSSIMKPISPSEINEAVRRYWSAQLDVTGPFHRWCFGKRHSKLLAC